MSTLAGRLGPRLNTQQPALSSCQDPALACFNALPAPSAPRLALGSWGFCPHPGVFQGLSPTPLAEVSGLGGALLPLDSLIPSGGS